MQFKIKSLAAMIGAAIVLTAMPADAQPGPPPPPRAEGPGREAGPPPPPPPRHRARTRTVCKKVWRHGEPRRVCRKVRR
ncbi:hypothetical protein WSK_0644 [Novosphingobium sp. Rr 2-17]|uniref:hypothetical protein n=1 Tax=Novosphingobium sp. Rr 2-17 TaxID=555793 RepID=UPI000269AAE5|nr:hypothetical protein [Novosphingobium sp. Rr 2-17]EIZ80671.1 hypothetical protein WSK_0644 [Novosphingobium sp. Rr 2-17]